MQSVIPYSSYDCGYKSNRHLTEAAFVSLMGEDSKSTKGKNPIEHIEAMQTTIGFETLNEGLK